MKLLLCVGLVIASCLAQQKQERRFPDDFIFGAATSAYQVEGGWNADGKGESIWDRLTHTNINVVLDQSTGDVAADSYNNYKRDVEMMRELGLDAYRFSMAWSRILPDGTINNVNEAGVAFYNNLIDEMLKYNIKPMVTLYHWDLPQKLQDLGGFMNPLFPEWFEDYARLAFERFGDRVKLWITFNEPREICYEGYGWYTKAPQVNRTDIGTYHCARYLILAHAKAYHAYNQDFKPTQQGQCGITISVNWFGPVTDTEEDEYAAELRRQAEWGIYAHPIFSEEGDWPKDISDIVAQKSIEQGYKTSRLPEFSEEEKKFVQGSYDFFGVNHYSSYLVSANEYKDDHPIPSILADVDVGVYRPPEWLPSASTWLVMAPNSVYNALSHLMKMYNNPPFYITENGWSENPEAPLIDDVRILYYRSALNSALDAIEAGVNLKGYMAWSLVDNYEWTEGYTIRFGLYQVDFESEQRTRTARKSAFVYKQIVKSHMIDSDYEPDTMTMSIDEGH